MRGGVFRRKVGTVRAVDGVSFDIRAGRDPRPSSASRAAARPRRSSSSWSSPSRSAGASWSGARCCRRSNGGSGARCGRDIQIVFQDPSAAVDPRLPVGDVIGEPLLAQRVPREAREKRRAPSCSSWSGSTRDGRALPARVLGRSAAAHRHRAGLATDPSPGARRAGLGARRLDPGRRHQPARRTCATSSDCRWLFVAHDLAVVRHIADEVAVMYLGRIVEQGPIAEVFDDPKHPYTQALMSAMPMPDPVAERERSRVLLDGDLPSPADDRRLPVPHPLPALQAPRRAGAGALRRRRSPAATHDGVAWHAITSHATRSSSADPSPLRPSGTVGPPEEKEEAHDPQDIRTGCGRGRSVPDCSRSPPALRARPRYRRPTPMRFP